VIQGKALVTGVAGTIGSRLARHLADRGCTVHGVDLFDKGKVTEEVVRGWGVTPWKRDLTADSLDDLPEVDYVFHEACQWDAHKGGDPDRRVVMAHNSLMAARTVYRWRGATAIMLASTGGIYGDSAEPRNEDAPPAPDHQGYHLGKLAMEQIALCYSLQFSTPMVILRYFWPISFEDLAQRYVRAVQDGRAIPGTGASAPYRWAPIDFADVLDYTVCSVELASVPPTVFVCGGPETVSRRQLVETAAAALGNQPAFDERPAGWRGYLSDSSRLYAALGEPKLRLTEVVRRVAEAARDG